MIITQHGTYERPSVYFSVDEEQKYSEMLDRFFSHETLQLEFDYHGPTEVGGLILDPEYRTHRLKLGKLLSYLRFLFIGMHREWFRDRIVADLLPPLREDGGSDLWDCLGQHFTGIHYRKADRLSRDSVEFVQSLFPSERIYTSLLPDRARNKIGVVGEKTKPAAVMLESIGFSYDHRIDPFDGGPTYAVETDECTPVERTRWTTFDGLLESGEEPEGLGLVGYECESHEVRFRSALVEYRRTSGGLRLRSDALSELRLELEDDLGFLPLTGPEWDTLYEPRDEA
jgi:arginine N-succinyltransferase